MYLEKLLKKQETLSCKESQSMLLKIVQVTVILWIFANILDAFYAFQLALNKSFKGKKIHMKWIHKIEIM